MLETKYKTNPDGSRIMEEQKFWDYGHALSTDPNGMKFFDERNFEPYAVCLVGMAQPAGGALVTAKTANQVPIFCHFYRRAYMMEAPIIDDSETLLQDTSPKE